MQMLRNQITPVGVRGKRLTAVNAAVNTFFKIFFIFLSLVGVWDTRALRCNVAISSVSAWNVQCQSCSGMHVRACASLRHRHNSTSVQVSCFPGSRTVPAQPARAGSVTQSLWNGERLSGGRALGHGEALAEPAVWPHQAESSMVPTLQMNSGFCGSP